jgi:hypothetical protein
VPAAGQPRSRERSLSGGTKRDARPTTRSISNAARWRGRGLLRFLADGAGSNRGEVWKRWSITYPPGRLQGRSPTHRLGRVPIRSRSTLLNGSRARSSGHVLRGLRGGRCRVHRTLTGGPSHSAIDKAAANTLVANTRRFLMWLPLVRVLRLDERVAEPADDHRRNPCARRRPRSRAAPAFNSSTGSGSINERVRIPAQTTTSILARQRPRLIAST